MRHGNPDIYGYDRTSTTAFPVCTDPAIQDQPAVWSDAVGTGTVVWRDQRNATSTGSDIYGYDLATSREFAICRASGDQSAPAIDHDLVMWSDGRTSAALQVRGYDLSLQQEFPVSVGQGHQGQPTVSGEQVVWTRQQAGLPPNLPGAQLTPWDASLTIDGAPLGRAATPRPCSSSRRPKPAWSRP